jgi:hypothetical protein
MGGTWGDWENIRNSVRKSGRPKHGLKGNVMTYLKVRVWDIMDTIEEFQDSISWAVLVNIALNLWVPQPAWKPMKNAVTSSFCKRALLHGAIQEIRQYQITNSSNLTSCSLVRRHQCFRESCCLPNKSDGLDTSLRIPGIWRRVVWYGSFRESYCLPHNSEGLNIVSRETVKSQKVRRHGWMAMRCRPYHT